MGSPSPSAQEDGELSNQGSNDDDFSDLFVIDKAPNVARGSRVDAPVYEKKFLEVLKVQPKEDKDAKPERAKPPQNTCWNCSGDHSMRDCPEPKNYEVINRSRQIFMNKQAQKTLMKGSRYHLDSDQKYPHVEAGKISKRLRRALGLQSNQLPRHIYRMRCLGYPPGWVEEARVSHSGLFLFNSEGQEVADPRFEDGEVLNEEAKDRFDIKKIIEYPGFNCPCDPKTIDETERLNSKPMTEKDGIKFMKTMWQPKAFKAYKRRKMRPQDTDGVLKSSKGTEDMEIESDDEVDDEEGEVVEEGVEKTVQITNQSNPKDKKRRDSVSPSPVDSKRLRVEETASCSSNPQHSDSAIESLEEPPKGVDSSSSPPTPSNLGKVMSVALGTPVIVTSPFTCLPSADKFAKNICDVINFENLPDATGKYEKMSGLIKKVRTFVSKLNTEEDEDEDEEELP